MSKEFIKKLTEIVEANMANEAFGTEDLAREMGMSHSNLHRKLKTITNQTISQFIREERLKKAKKLLLNEDMTAAEIAYSVGFGSPTYFNKCFHEYFGHAPGEFRKEEQWSERELPIDNSPKRRRQTKVFITLFIALIILVPFFVFILDKINLIEASKIDEKSIAVLPFKYMSNEDGKQYLADGMMDAIVLNLSKIKDLRVVSRTSVEQYRKTDKTIGQIGKELNVAYLLEGSFQKEGDKIRLILQLLTTKDEGHVWSDDFDREWKDVFLVQSEVAETIAGELDALITPVEQQLIRKYPTASLTAYDFYEKGNDELDNSNDSAALIKAKGLFQKALKMDSTFSKAIAGLARINHIKCYGNAFLSKNYMDSVLILANKALSYDSQCAEGYFYRGLYYYERAKPEEALKEIDKSIKFDPNFWRAYYIRSQVLSIGLADFAGAISDLHKAILRNRGKELPNLYRAMGYYLVDYGFPDVANRFFNEALELDGDSNNYLLCIGSTEYASENFEKAYQVAKNIYKKDTNIVNDLCLYATMSGRYEESYKLSLKQIESIKKKGEIDLWNSKGIGYFLWKKGRIKEAKSYFDQHIQNNRESIRLGRWNAVQKGAYFDLAEVYAFTGDHEKAYQYLDEVIKVQAFPIWWVILFKYEPLFETIRQEPRFQDILKVVDSKYQAEHERVRQWLVAQEML